METTTVKTKDEETEGTKAVIGLMVSQSTFEEIKAVMLAAGQELNLASPMIDLTGFAIKVKS